MTDRIFFADERAQQKIDALRMQEYANATGFAVDLTTLKWRTSDSESFVMVAESKGQFISTMRGEIIEDLRLLERKLECPWTFPLELDLPVLLLSRAATLSAQRSSGLNLVLRYWFLRLAMAFEIGYVIGTFVAGSPRENALREMGYQFFTNDRGWQQSTYRSLRPVSVVALNMKTHGEHALSYCLNRVGPGIHQYHFNEQYPELRIVRSL